MKDPTGRLLPAQASQGTEFLSAPDDLDHSQSGGVVLDLTPSNYSLAFTEAKCLVPTQICGKPGA